MVNAEYSSDGIKYCSSLPTTSDWLTVPECFGNDSILVSFLSQLEEEGICEYCDDKVFLPWPSLFQLIHSDDYASSIYLLRLPVTVYNSSSETDGAILT